MTSILVGSTTTLKPPAPEDSPAYFRWINDREVVEFNAQYAPVSQADHDRWFGSLNRQSHMVLFSIWHNETKTLIGSTSLRNISQKHRHGELQIRIGERAFWSKGCGSEAVHLLVGYGFEILQLHRIFLQVFDDNPRAICAYEKVGFVREGVLRESEYVANSYKNKVVMSILRSEWAGGANQTA